MPKELERLLYVEDDENIAEIAMMTLEDVGGFEVRHCSSGQEALDAIMEFAPQLVVMDVMMPDMDGPKTLEKLRLMPDVGNIPVIFMTAKAQVHEQSAYLAKGALGVILKPFDPMTLPDQIRDIWAKGAVP